MYDLFIYFFIHYVGGYGMPGGKHGGSGEYNA